MTSSTLAADGRSPAGSGRLRDVVAGGVIGGTLDLIYICSLYLAWKSLPPTVILRSIAAGWLGPEAAYAGGAATALLGLVTHYGIATTMAFVYFAVAMRVPALVRKPFLYGPLYGIVLYAAMTFVVVPLSAAGTGKPMQWRWLELAHLGSHMLLVALPCALGVRRALERNRGRTGH